MRAGNRVQVIFKNHILPLFFFVEDTRPSSTRRNVGPTRFFRLVRIDINTFSYGSQYSHGKTHHHCASRHRGQRGEAWWEKVSSAKTKCTLSSKRNKISTADQTKHCSQNKVRERRRAIAVRFALRGDGVSLGWLRFFRRVHHELRCQR